MSTLSSNLLFLFPGGCLKYLMAKDRTLLQRILPFLHFVPDGMNVFKWPCISNLKWFFPVFLNRFYKLIDVACSFAFCFDSFCYVSVNIRLQVFHCQIFKFCFNCVKTHAMRERSKYKPFQMLFLIAFLFMLSSAHIIKPVCQFY